MNLAVAFLGLLSWTLTTEPQCPPDTQKREKSWGSERLFFCQSLQTGKLHAAFWSVNESGEVLWRQNYNDGSLLSGEAQAQEFLRVSFWMGDEHPFLGRLSGLTKEELRLLRMAKIESPEFVYESQWPPETRNFLRRLSWPERESQVIAIQSFQCQENCEMRPELMYGLSRRFDSSWREALQKRWDQNQNGLDDLLEEETALRFQTLKVNVAHESWPSSLQESLREFDEDVKWVEAFELWARIDLKSEDLPRFRQWSQSHEVFVWLQSASRGELEP